MEILNLIHPRKKTMGQGGLEVQVGKKRMGTLKLTTWVTKEAPALEGASLPPRGRGPPPG